MHQQDWPLSNGEVFRVRLLSWKGREFVDVRRWYTADGELRPTPKGIRFNSELAGPLAELLAKVDAGEYAPATTKSTRPPRRRASQDGAA